MEMQILSVFGLNKTKHRNSLDISTLNTLNSSKLRSAKNLGVKILFHFIVILC